MQKIDDDLRNQIPFDVYFRQDSNGLYLTVPAAPNTDLWHLLKQYTVRYTILFLVAIPCCVFLVLSMFFSKSIISATISELVAGSLIMLFLGIGRSVVKWQKRSVEQQSGRLKRLQVSLTRHEIRIEKHSGEAIYPVSNIRGISNGVLILRGQREVDILAEVDESERNWLSNVILWTLRQSKAPPSHSRSF